MTTLDEFNRTTPDRLVDFTSNKRHGSGVNHATASNIATHASVLGVPDNVLKNYSMISSEIEAGDDSPTLNEILKEQKTTDQALSYEELQKILADPAIDADSKSAYMTGYMNMTVSKTDERSLATLVGHNAAQLPQSEEENDETAATQMYNVLAEGLDEVDRYRAWTQAQINMADSLKDRDFFNLTVDVLEGFVPFTDQAALAKVQAGAGDDIGKILKTFALVGDSKVDLRKKLATLPVDQRYAMAQKLIDIIKSGGGSWTIRPNELNKINQLNQILSGDAYGTDDQVLDNIFSMLDIIAPVAGVFKKFGKGAKEAAAIAKRGELAAKADAKAGVVENAVEAPQTLPPSGNLLTNAIDQKIVDEVANAGQPVAGELKPTVNLIERNLGKKNPTLTGENPELITMKSETMGPYLDPMVELESEVKRLAQRTTIDHTSLSQTFKDTNAGKARSVNAMVEADPTNRSANALYGSSRAEAISNDRLPEIANPDGSVRNKVRMDESNPQPDATTINTIKKNNGRTDLDQAEKTQQRTQVKNAFTEVNGLVPRKEMGTVEDTSAGVNFDMVYGPTDGGFRNARQGIQQILIGLRKYGVKGSEVEILAKDATGRYVPVSGIPTQEGNYLVRVKHNYEFTPTDVVDHTLLGSSKYKMFESRTSLTDGNAGSWLEHLIPASSIINRVIFNSASVAADKSAWINKQLVKLAHVYAKKYTKLSPRQKALLDAYRIEANEKGIAFTTANLRARGFDDDAIDAMRSWKTTTDTMWWLENVDVNKTLRSRGWSRFLDDVHDTDLIARAKPNRFGDQVKVYDPGSHSIRVVQKTELDELYAKNGLIAELKEEYALGDDAAEYILVGNNEGGYLRRIRDDDITMNYRDGYYPVKYTDPIFIEKKFKYKNGVEKWRAVATAGNQSDAKALIERLKATDETGEYNPRYDYKRGTQQFDDADWSAAVSGGRSSQRVRGKRLADSNSVTDLAHANVESPEESLISSIRSVASRTAWRDWLETTKTRWMANYGDMVDKQNGQIMWPADVRQIGKGTIAIDKARLQDAKTTWRYVRAMESGYVNLLDDLSKNFFQGVSDTAGGKAGKGWEYLEKGAGKLSEVSPTAFARKKAFRLLLAANPLRQLPVQAMQALPVLMATNPLAIPKISMQMILLDYLANGGDAVSFMKGVAKAATGMDAKSAAKLVEDWHASGFEAAVDANSLIRDQLGSIVDRTFIQKASTLGSKPLDVLQKIGFNKGEQILMRSVWLSEYDLLLKTGKKIDAEALENLNARVRNLTLNMNKAGELPYNENAFSVGMQFFQAPHKAWAQILLGNTSLSGADRLKLGSSYILTYGIGGGFLTDSILKGIGTSDPETREMVEGGMFNLMLNNALSTLTGETVRTDFSDSLRLLDPEVFMFWNSLIDSEVGEVLSSSASVSLVLGQSPRITNFVKQLMRPFIVNDDKKPEELQLLGISFLNLFSGTSNILKAKYALENLKTISSKGKVIDYHVNATEAFLKAAGFNTIDEVNYYASQEEIYRASQGYKDDIKKVVDEVSSRLAAKGISNEEEGYYLDMMAEAQRVFKNDPVYMKEFAQQIYYKALAGEDSLYRVLRAMSGYTSAQDFEQMVMRSNMTEGAKKTLLQSKRMMETSSSPVTTSIPQPAVQGNINLDTRQVVKNSDGSISTEQSISIEEDGYEVLIPTVFNGKHHTEDEAVAYYHKTGQHLGKFKSVADADAYAESLHNRQGVKYGDK